MTDDIQKIQQFVRDYVGTLQQLTSRFTDRETIFMPHELTPFKVDAYQCSDGVLVDFIEPHDDGPLSVRDTRGHTMGEVLRAVSFGGFNFTAKVSTRAEIVPAFTVARLTARNSRTGEERRVHEIQLWWQRDVQRWTEDVPQRLAVERIQQHLFMYSLGFGADAGPSPTTRADLESVCNEYQRLIEDESVREEALQHFLHDHPILLSPAHEAVIPKQEIGCGREYEIDFVIREPASRYLIVEIEKPSTRIMTKAGNFTAEFNHAERQMLDFISWIESNLHTARTAMPDIATPRGVIVVGHTKQLDDSGRARMAAKSAATRAKYEFFCFDELLERARRLANLLRQY